MSMEDNGNVGLIKPTSSSNEDLSEYTDADESVSSAPTEFLAEFLSAVMMKDYVTALKYCKLILQYEPNNGTAKEFYPLILEKLQNNISDDGSSGESDDDDDASSSSSSSSDSSNTSSDDSSDLQDDEEEGVDVGGKGDKASKGSSEGDATTTGSYSSLEDDEAGIDQLAALAAKYQIIDNVDFGNGNKIYNSSSVPNNLNGNTSTTTVTTGNLPLFGTGSDSESPTEPVTQQTVQLLRAKVVPNN